jgi:16S rRNA C967 or C1407 C5-methylase (RsmB/RsmF family)/NOL1/NOP2/fmu family ribosome biogenesis protein
VKTLPDKFIEQIRIILGDEYTAFLHSLNEDIPVSIRLNPFKPLPPDYYLSLNFSPTDGSQKVLWASDAYYLDARPVFTLDPLFHAGCYYVQEASSMFLEHFIKRYVSGAVVALDLCAAPGGKATHLSAVLPEGSLLVANETVRQRVNILSENLIKWGNPNTVVTNNDASEIGKYKEIFDLIVCDLPCSGEGMFRKDAAAIDEWSPENVKFCADRQRRIIADIFPSLKAGGILIYSTCTYNREENEDNIDWLCSEFDATLLEPPRRFWPHKDRGEGFFIAGIRKRNSEYEDATHTVVNTLNKLKIIYDGRNLSNYSNDNCKIAPPHALAMLNTFQADLFPRWELSRQSALEYLHREALRNMPEDLPQGFVTVTYRNRPLGFVKNIGNRANNLYPQEWRIRMALGKSDRANA